MKTLIAAFLLLPLIVSAQVAVRTQCPKHNWVGRAGENCPYCVAAANRSVRTPTSPGITPTPTPGLTPAMQATTDVLQKGFSQIFDAMMVPNSSPGINPQRARQLQQQAEQDRQAEEQRHERLIGSLKLLGYSASPAAPSLQNNPLGLKLGRSAQTDQSTDASADGLRPAGTAFFGLGGNGNPAIGATNNAPANAPSDRLGNDTTAANQLLTATGGRSGAVFDGKGVTGKSLVKPLDFKRLAVSIKENTEFLKLNQKRNESIALFEQLQTQIAALRLKLAVPGADTAIMDARIREMEARQRQAEVYVDYTNQEMKHQFKVDVEEQ